MSDDDLWRGRQDSADGSSDPESPSESSTPGVGDETQPLHGASPSSPASSVADSGAAASGAPESGAPVPPAAPPGPSYGPSYGSSYGSSPGAVPPPTNPFGHPSPYGAPPPQNPYAAPGSAYAPPPNPYPAPNEYAPPQSPYGSPYQPTYAGGALPDHPSASTAMVLGIVGLVGLVCGGFLLVVSPVAWYLGAKAVREIDASPGRYAGRDKANGGKIMGIIGTILLVLGLIAVAGLIALIAVSGNDPQPVGPAPGPFTTG